MRAGTAIRDITPDRPMLLCGYPESPMSTGVHDRLFVSVFYLCEGYSDFFYFTTDLCFFARSRAEKIVKAVSEATGVHQDRILVSATHTHSAPCPDCDIYNEVLGPELCPEYMDFVQAQFVNASREAFINTFKASISVAAGRCGKEQGIGGNRHDPEYAADPSVDVLAIRDEGNVIRGCIVNYALHPTILAPTNSLITADYVAYIHETVKESYPEAVFGFMQGCSGNQSSRYFRKAQTFEEAERFGRCIGSEAVRVIQNMVFSGDTLDISAKRVAFYPDSIRAVPDLSDALAAAQEAKANYDALIASHAAAAVCRSAECTMIGMNMMEIYARGVNKYGTQAIIDTTLPIVLHFVKIGNTVIVGISAEVFADIGISVKASSPFKNTMISCLTGGSPQSYICSDYAYERMYYEPAGSLFSEGIAEKLVEELRRQVDIMAQS